MAEACRALGLPSSAATSASTTRPRAATSTRRRSSACSASSTTSIGDRRRACRARLQHRVHRSSRARSRGAREGARRRAWARRRRPGGGGPRCRRWRRRTVRRRDGNRAQSAASRCVPRSDVDFFDETPSRIVVAVTEADIAAVVDRCRAADVPVKWIGAGGGDRIVIGESIDVALADRVGSMGEPVAGCVRHRGHALIDAAVDRAAADPPRRWARRVPHRDGVRARRRRIQP